MVVLRGARLDRFLPTLSPRFTGGFATMMREGIAAEATTGAVRSWAALQTAATGIAADQHGLQEPTDLLSEEAPTLGTVLAEHPIQTTALTDEAAWIGSGADRGYGRREGCPEAQPLCRVGPMFQSIADSVSANRGPSFTLLVTRVGTIPLDPPNDLVLALDPVPFEGTLTPAHTGVLAARARTTEIRLEPRDRARLDLLYDASLLAVDRGLEMLIERLQAHRLDDSTLLLVVGDRGVALADGRYFGDGPIWRPEILSTVLLARGPGITRGSRLRGVVGTLDAAATALDALGVPLPEEFEGVSIFEPERLMERALPLVATPRGELGLRFGDWLALPRPAPQPGVSLFDRSSSQLSRTPPPASATTSTASKARSPSSPPPAPPTPPAARSPAPSSTPTAHGAAPRTLTLPTLATTSRAPRSSPPSPTPPPPNPSAAPPPSPPQSPSLPCHGNPTSPAATSWASSASPTAPSPSTAQPSPSPAQPSARSNPTPPASSEPSTCPQAHTRSQSPSPASLPSPDL
jgi:hypothetical protein